MGFTGQFALHQPLAADVGFGSVADMAAAICDVRLYSRKRTFLSASWMSALCHNRTNGTEAKNWVKGTRDYRRASRIRTSPITAVPPP